MSVVYFWWLQGVSNQQRASASATDCKEKKKKKLHLQKGQISADTSRLAENRVSGSLEFHFHLSFC